MNIKYDIKVAGEILEHMTRRTSSQPTENCCPCPTDMDIDDLSGIGELSPRLVVYLDYIQQYCKGLGHELGFARGNSTSIQLLDGKGLIDEKAVYIGLKGDPLGPKFEIDIVRTEAENQTTQLLYAGYRLNTGSLIYEGFTPSDYLEHTVDRLCIFLGEQGCLLPAREPAPMVVREALRAAAS